MQDCLETQSPKGKAGGLLLFSENFSRLFKNKCASLYCLVGAGGQGPGVAAHYKFFPPHATPETCLVTGETSISGTEHSPNGFTVPALEHNQLHTDLTIKPLQQVARRQVEWAKTARGTTCRRVMEVRISPFIFLNIIFWSSISFLQAYSFCFFYLLQFRGFH